MSAPASDPAYALARPLWADIDLAAITYNLALLKERAGRPVKIIVPVKANAYGHGIVEVSRHLARLGVNGLATANLDDALAARRASVTIPILMYGSQLPEGNQLLLEHALTPSVYSREGLNALTALADSSGRRINVHVKVDAGLGRLGVRLDEAAAFVREVLACQGLHLEGIYTHIPFGDPAGEAWSRRRMAAFAGLVRAIEAEHGIRIKYAQGAASSVLARAFEDSLNTISPGHLVYGLFPIGGERAEAHGFRKALAGVRARLIHVAHRRKGDDLYGAGPGEASVDATVGTILFGMDNGYRPAPPGPSAVMLCRGQRCPVLGVTAEYTVIDLSGVSGAKLGDVVTVVGEDGSDSISAEDVAQQLGVPSAAYWMVGLSNVPLCYRN